MPRILKIVIIVLVSVLGFAVHHPPRQGMQDGVYAMKILSVMFDSIKNVRTASYNIKALERIEGKYSTANSFVKIQTKPKIIYFRNEKKKLSILYAEGENNNMALVKAKMLFNTTLKLDPTGSVMRKNQHYTIMNLGFDFIGKTIATALIKEKEHLATELKYLGREQLNNMEVHKIGYLDKNYSITDYIVGEGESVSSIAIKLNLSDYAIRSYNDLHSYHGTIKKGRILKVPNNYCKAMTLCIDTKTGLPVGITTIDEVGLYENYEYYNLKINPVFSKSDFDLFQKD